MQIKAFFKVCSYVPGKGNVSYLSANICEEFIDLMSKQVMSKILAEIKEAKYYSISVDSTPDVAHTEQLTFVVRYVLKSGPIERFMQFVPIYSHEGKSLASVVSTFLSDNGIPIEDCRGQSYDNAPNMSGRYNGVQAHILEKNELAFFVPCAAHSLNLAGVKAAECCPQSVRFFGLVQKIYCFFSSSTYRWSILRENVGVDLSVKRLSDTRWSAHFEAVRALYVGYEKIKCALHVIANDCDQEGCTRQEASGLSKKMEHLETVFLSIFWYDVLERLQKISIFLQSRDVDMSALSDLFTSFLSYLQQAREMFDEYETRAKTKYPDAFYSDLMGRPKKRNVRLNPLGDLCTSDEPSGSDKMRGETFFPIVDALMTEIKKRADAYSFITNTFNFLVSLPCIPLEKLESNCKSLAQIYKGDLEYDNLFNECKHFKAFLEDIDDKENISLPYLYNRIMTDGLKCVFPNIEIALRIYLCFFVTTCSGERSFSQLKLIKNCLRNSTGQDRLNRLSLLCIEHELLSELDMEPIIDQFYLLKNRKCT